MPTSNDPPADLPSGSYTGISSIGSTPRVDGDDDTGISRPTGGVRLIGDAGTGDRAGKMLSGLAGILNPSPYPFAWAGRGVLVGQEWLPQVVVLNPMHLTAAKLR